MKLFLKDFGLPPPSKQPPSSAKAAMATAAGSVYQPKYFPVFIALLLSNVNGISGGKAEE
jgi:hypothetical protein